VENRKFVVKTKRPTYNVAHHHHYNHHQHQPIAHRSINCNNGRPRRSTKPTARFHPLLPSIPCRNTNLPHPHIPYFGEYPARIYQSVYAVYFVLGLLSEVLRCGLGDMVSYDPCDEYVPCSLYAFLGNVLMEVYQQSSQVESYFSTADYTWMLLITGAVVMVPPGSPVVVYFFFCAFVIWLLLPFGFFAGGWCSSFCLATVYASTSRGSW